LVAVTGTGGYARWDMVAETPPPLLVSGRLLAAGKSSHTGTAGCGACACYRLLVRRDLERCIAVFLLASFCDPMATPTLDLLFNRCMWK
jgi:hypothetical protein